MPNGQNISAKMAFRPGTLLDSMLPARRVDIEESHCAPKYLWFKGDGFELSRGGDRESGLIPGGWPDLLPHHRRERALHDSEGLGNVGSIAQKKREYCHQQ